MQYDRPCRRVLLATMSQCDTQPLLLVSVETVLQRAAKMAVGMHATATEGAITRQRDVTPNVLLAGMHVLSAIRVWGAAHLRYHECTAVAPPTRSGVRGDGQLPADLAPDLVGAAVRASMAVDNAWQRRVPGLQPDLAEARAEAATAGARRRLPNRAITVVAKTCTTARKGREGATEPPPPARSSRGRCLKKKTESGRTSCTGRTSACAPTWAAVTMGGSSNGCCLKRVYPVLRGLRAGQHMNVIRDIALAGAACHLPPYRHTSSPSVLPVLASRSCYLPHDHNVAASLPARVHTRRRKRSGP